MEENKGIRATKSAASRVVELMDSENSGEVMLRVSVAAGGCSGFEYSFALDNKKTSQDIVFESNGIKLIVDEVSLDLLDGSEVDYVDDLAGASFRLKIPNAPAACGCGISFSV